MQPNSQLDHPEIEIDCATIAWNMLSERNWLRISKPLMHYLGDRPTILLCELVSLDHYHRKDPKYNGWFKAPVELLWKHTAQKKDTQLKSELKLEKRGILKKKRMGIPASNWYLLNYPEIIKLFGLDFPIKSIDSLKPSNLVTRNPPSSELESSHVYNKDLSNKEESNEVNNKNLTAPPSGFISSNQPDPPHNDKPEYIPIKRVRSTPVPPPQSEDDPDPPKEEKKPDPIRQAGAAIMRDSSKGAKDGFASLFQTALNLPAPRGSNFWANAIPLGQLQVQDGLEPGRIRSMIAWLHDHHSDEWAPGFFNGYDFRKKFSQLEKFRSRTEIRQKRERKEEALRQHISEEYLTDPKIYKNKKPVYEEH